MTLALPRAAVARPTTWIPHGAALALVSLALLAIFRRDVADLTRLWWTSTTFGHCLFIGPVVAWLVHGRRRELARLHPIAWWPGLLLVAAGGFGWLLGEAGGVALARQLGLLLMLQGAVMALLGHNVARGLLFPLGYSLFLVPFGQELEEPLQRVTVSLVRPMLHLVGVSAQVDGVLIHAGRYWFEVAEACSGAKFLLAMLAFGVLVAGTCFRSWRRRAAWLLLCVVVPVLANGVRAFATIWAANLTSVEAATGFDHIVYGWVFFALVMAGLIAAGWRWFDRAPDEPAFDPERLHGPVRGAFDLTAAALLVLATAAVFPAWAAAIDRARPGPERIDLPEPPGWRRVPLSRIAPWEPNHPAADHRLFGRYEDGRGHAVDMAVALYLRPAEGREPVAFGVGALGENDRWVKVADIAPIAGGSAMRIVAPGPVERTVATWYRLGGMTSSDPVRVKFEIARARLLGRDRRTLALHLSAEGLRAAETIAAFARALQPLGPTLDRIADGR